MTPHVTLKGNLENVVIGQIKHHGQKCQAFFDYPSFDSCYYLSLVESLHEARDEEYGVATTGIDKPKFMCSNPTNNNNIVELKKTWFTFEQV